ncbi:MAG: 50S ribosomal protein L4 [bacterium]
MVALNMIDKDGNSMGTVDFLPEEKLDEKQLNKILVSEVVEAFRSKMRQGTHSTKTYATISGGGAKPWRQKGTGRARRGTLRASTIRGGAPAFGPQPRTYGKKVSKKKKRIAVLQILAEKIRNGEIVVMKDFEMKEIATKNAYRILRKNAGIEKALVLSEENDILEKSLKNIPVYKYSPYNSFNIMDLMRYEKVVLTEKAVKKLNGEKTDE